MRILFLLRKRCLQYGEQRYTSLRSSGLRNSAGFVYQLLRQLGHDVKLVEVEDGNSIDRETHQFRPQVVILEAFWATPAKLRELHRLHPKVLWVVRCHSELPFLQHEGIAFDWIFQYLTLPYVRVAFNSQQTYNEFLPLVTAAQRPRVLYLPNYYPVPDFAPGRPRDWEHAPRDRADALDVGCFGAIRPQKNHIPQAIAAMAFADANGRRLYFHVNATRVEGRGDAVLKNLRALFAARPEHTLVEHEWLDHEAFLRLVGSMDVCMQVSFTESFNIVTADAVTQGVPVVVSDQIDWVDSYFWADPTSVQDMRDAIRRALYHRKWVGWWDVNYKRLRTYALAARREWIKWLGSVPVAPTPKPKPKPNIDRR